MIRYDPDAPPDPSSWLALDDWEREQAALDWHDAHDEPALHVEGHPRELHAALHVMVETQIAREEPPAVARAVARLSAEGLRRHAALHAVMAVFVQDIVAIAHAEADADPDTSVERYASRLAQLDASDVIASNMRRGIEVSDDPGPDAPPNRAERRAAARRDRKSTKRR